MKIPMAFLADEANISQEGKLNVMGIFDRISASSFPVVHPRMVFCFRVQMDFADSGRTFPVQVLLLDGENGVMFEASGEIMAPAVPVNEFATANQVFALVGVQFPREGTYRFVVAIGAEEPYETPFLVHAPMVDPMLN